MSEWRPIKTAPKDGTWVLLKGGNTKEFGYLWEKADIVLGCQYGDDRPVVAKFMPDYCDGYWTYAYWDSGWRSTYDKPTHWMPLPE